MQKRSLLYIGNKLSKKGGTVATIDTLSPLLEHLGYEVITASSYKNKVVRLLYMLFATIFYSRRVSVVLIDTYSTLNFYYAVAVGYICRVLDLPYIPILHGGNLPERLLKSPNRSKKYFAGARLNVSPSHYLLESFKLEGFHNTLFIPNSIEIENYPFLLRKEIHPKLLWVRSFAEIYNPMLAIEVVKSLLKKGVEVSLTMVGPEKDGSMKKCKAEAEKQNLPISFTGKLERSQWIALSQDYCIFINTTNFDNTPVSVIEAMALGIPIVSTNVGGMPFLIDNNETGVLIPPKNPDAFVDAILQLLNDPSFTESLSRAARMQAEAFDWQEVKSTWFALLNE